MSRVISDQVFKLPNYNGEVRIVIEDDGSVFVINASRVGARKEERVYGYSGRTTDLSVGVVTDFRGGNVEAFMVRDDGPWPNMIDRPTMKALLPLWRPEDKDKITFLCSPAPEPVAIFPSLKKQVPAA